MLLRRAAAVLTTTVVVGAAAATPALATVNNFPDDPPGEAMTAVQALALFLGIPLALAAVVSLLVMAPSWTRAGRVGPGGAWFAEPTWLHSSTSGLAPDTAAVLEAAPAPAAVPAPATAPARAGAVEPVDLVDGAPVRGTQEPLHTGGGAGARW